MTFETQPPPYCAGKNPHPCVGSGGNTSVAEPLANSAFTAFLPVQPWQMYSPFLAPFLADQVTFFSVKFWMGDSARVKISDGP